MTPELVAEISARMESIARIVERLERDLEARFESLPSVTERLAELEQAERT